MEIGRVKSVGSVNSQLLARILTQELHDSQIQAQLPLRLCWIMQSMADADLLRQSSVGGGLLQNWFAKIQQLLQSDSDSRQRLVGAHLLLLSVHCCSLADLRSQMTDWSACVSPLLRLPQQVSVHATLLHSIGAMALRCATDATAARDFARDIVPRVLRTVLLPIVIEQRELGTVTLSQMRAALHCFCVLMRYYPSVLRNLAAPLYDCACAMLWHVDNCVRQCALRLLALLPLSGALQHGGAGMSLQSVQRQHQQQQLHGGQPLQDAAEAAALPASYTASAMSSIVLSAASSLASGAGQLIAAVEVASTSSAAAAAFSGVGVLAPQRWTLLFLSTLLTLNELVDVLVSELPSDKHIRQMAVEQLQLATAGAQLGTLHPLQPLPPQFSADDPRWKRYLYLGFLFSISNYV